MADGTKVQIGFGGNCRKHKNLEDGPTANPCQKQVTFPVGSSPEVVAEARRLCKTWLLLGRRVCDDHPSGRQEHLHKMGGRWLRQSAPSLTEEQLDRMVLVNGAHP